VGGRIAATASDSRPNAPAEAAADVEPADVEVEESGSDQEEEEEEEKEEKEEVEESDSDQEEEKEEVEKEKKEEKEEVEESDSDQKEEEAMEDKEEKEEEEKEKREEEEDPQPPAEQPVRECASPTPARGAAAAPMAVAVEFAAPLLAASGKEKIDAALVEGDAAAPPSAPSQVRPLHTAHSSSRTHSCPAPPQQQRQPQQQQQQHRALPSLISVGPGSAAGQLVWSPAPPHSPCLPRALLTPVLPVAPFLSPLILLVRAAAAAASRPLCRPRSPRREIVRPRLGRAWIRSGQQQT